MSAKSPSHSWKTSGMVETIGLDNASELEAFKEGKPAWDERGLATLFSDPERLSPDGIDENKDLHGTSS